MGGVNGIESLVYGVDDVPLCTRYFADFGLPLVSSTEKEAVFELEEGSSVIIRALDAARTERQSLVGFGVQQVIWGVPDRRTLDQLAAQLRRHTEVSEDADGTVRFFDGDGISCGIRVFRKKTIWGAPDPVNSFGNIQRRNVHRRWRLRALPKTIQHVVFMTPDPHKSWEWYRDVLNFRLSDVQEGFGVFSRASGTNDHHNIYWLRADLPFPGLDGRVRFNHVNFGVEDLDEVMVGANYMERKGWAKSVWGLGRHRIASSVFLYLPCPAGGEAEYGCDSDSLDDNWVPRTWHAGFGTMSFMHNLQPWLLDEQPWLHGYAEGGAPGVEPHRAAAVHGADPHSTDAHAPAAVGETAVEAAKRPTELGETIDASPSDATGALPARPHLDDKLVRQSTSGH